MAGKQTARPFGLRDKLGYLFGDFGNDFTFLLSSSFLMKFYTDVMGVEAAVVGAVMMLARFVDAFTDVAVGRICDRSKVTSAGKFRPWILRMCVPVAISSFLIYQSGLSGMSTSFKVSYLVVTYILWGSLFYTFINIPYGSMASAISADPDHRQSLSTYRTMGGVLAGVIVGAGVPVFAYVRVDGNSVFSGGRFTVIAGIFSLLAVVCYLACYALTCERVRPDANSVRKEQSLVEMFRSTLTNRALISIIVASIILLLAQLTMQSMAGYVYPNYYNNPAAQSASTLAMLASMIVAALVAGPLSRRVGKAEISALTSLLSAVVCVILFAARPQNVWVFVALQALCWLGLGVFSMVSWALMTDVIDDAELRNGVREDGTVYALYSFARKLGQAASAGLTGTLLSAIGYSSITAFDSPVVEGIFNIATLGPALGFALLSAVLWFWYPLRKGRVEENVAALKRKHDR